MSFLFLSFFLFFAPLLEFWLTDGNSFGWVNASYIYGLQIVNVHMQRALGALVSWDEFRERVVAGEGEAGPAEGLAEGTPASAAPHP